MLSKVCHKLQDICHNCDILSSEQAIYFVRHAPKEIQYYGIDRENISFFLHQFGIEGFGYRLLDRG